MIGAQDTSKGGCTHGVTFDYEAAKDLDYTEVRKRWPRKMFTEEIPCPECGFVGIAYASLAHFVYGDW